MDELAHSPLCDEQNCLDATPIMLWTMKTEIDLDSD